NIGRRINLNGEWFEGDIDEVAIWNKALTQQEIQQRMIQPPAITTPGLVVYFPFDETVSTANTRELISKNQANKFGFNSNSISSGALYNSDIYIDESYTSADSVGRVFAFD